MKDANNPTRAEFIDLTLELEIDSVIKRQKEGTPITYEFYLKFLRKIRRQFVRMEFADDEELTKSVHALSESIHKQKELSLKLTQKQKNLSREGKAGAPPGPRNAPKKKWFNQAWFEHGANMKYPVYVEFLKKNKVEENGYYSPESFRKAMRKKIMGL